jgi:hypothetical protein
MEMHVAINMLTIRRAPSRALFGITNTIFMSLFFFVPMFTATERDLLDKHDGKALMRTHQTILKRKPPIENGSFHHIGSSFLRAISLFHTPKLHMSHV